HLFGRWVLLAHQLPDEEHRRRHAQRNGEHDEHGKVRFEHIQAVPVGCPCRRLPPITCRRWTGTRAAKKDARRALALSPATEPQAWYLLRRAQQASRVR